MRMFFAVTGLVVSLVILLVYYDYLPAFPSKSLPIHTSTYQLGVPKSYSRYIDPPDRPLHLVFDREAANLFASRANGIIEKWYLHDHAQSQVWQTNTVFSYIESVNSIIIKSELGNVEIFDLETQKLTPLTRDFYIHSAVDQSGKLLVLSIGGSSLEIWKLDKKRLFKRWDTHLPVRNGLAISYDGQYLAAAEGTYDSVANFHHTAIQLWSLKEKESQLLFNGEDEGEVHGVWSLSFSPDASLIATDTQVDGKSGVTVWNVPKGERVFEVRGFDSYWVRALAFSPGGKYLAMGNELGELLIWSFDLQEKVWHAQVGGQAIHSIAFSADGKLLAAGLQDSTIHVWHIGLNSDSHVLWTSDDS